ncbi:phosphate acetyltransferase [Gordonia sp. X0973]|uniref:phosphate acetyltransferase n=1 Tax=Gordonia sp. X0973 TaxID=2742602 RepID=UPI000F5457AC|nr:phosphate acetyltransferase [Gordonia sp. X0973]QKT06093.1 phosphate acetyltransferase [Gordonia sp. X0973]
MTDRSKGDQTVSETAHSAIYLASAEGETGKSTIALGLLALLSATGGRIGVFRPISRTHDGKDDYILELLLAHDSVGLDYADCIGVTYDQVHADPDGALATIVDRFHAVQEQCDTVLVVGSDYTDVGNPSELSYNARIAANLASPIVLALRANDRSPQDVRGMAEHALAEISAAHATAVAVIVNRVTPRMQAATREALDGIGPGVWVLPEDPVLSAPTMAELSEALHGHLYSGDEELLDREALHMMVGGMTAEHCLERLEEGMVVIAPADRSDVLLALVNANSAQGFPKLAGLILNGGLKPHPMIDALVRGLNPTLPIICCEQSTYETARIASHTRGKMANQSVRKVETSLALMEDHIDPNKLMADLNLAIPEVVTPQMFEYQLAARAKADLRHIVLPEGEEPRILRAAAQLVARGVARLTLLGDAEKVDAQIAELGVSLPEVDIINPFDSELTERFAVEYAELRKHKNVALDRARDLMRDVSYFGTMMVHDGLADGMVSGSVHTTAHTIRPAFEIIKTKPGVDTVSSVFFMCLADRVLTYGDCAVVPDPTAEQLADIAISSAETAAAFGIVPRVALLSYSTGESGSGAEVDKVRSATAIVRERKPDLLVEGPIQYDAAVEPSVAMTKMPDSPVAGQATVLIFPDLNTGNNTYKAVQRSAGAIAIGPVLQGLNKPINDLSRGALVADIVNTVAITAIQAQTTETAK